MNFVLGYSIQQSTQTTAQSHILQLRPHQHTHNTHLGAALHVVSHHVDKGPLVLEERVVEETMSVGGDLSQ